MVKRTESIRYINKFLVVGDFAMNMKDIKEIAAQKGLRAGRLKKEELIRVIQAAENNVTCFMTAQADSCGQTACLWRPDCR